MNELKKKIYGWSRYDSSISSLFYAKSIKDIKKIINFTIKKKKTIAIRSGGYSYGANTLNSNDIILHINQSKKIIKFNKKEGTIEVTGCCTLKEINQEINPTNWYLPVSPAHDGITVSGAVSNNVHGKNCFQNGYFGDYVSEIIFLSSKKKIIKCNKNLNKKLFYGLFGSIGFLGIILKVKIKLQKRLSNVYLNKTVKFSNFKNIMSIMKRRVKNSDYIISAIDFTRYSSEDGFVFISKNIDVKKFTQKLPIKGFYKIINIFMLLNKLKIFSKIIEYIFHLGVKLTPNQNKFKFL
jgi:FAD/FMN-containing dehydrogenase